MMLRIFSCASARSIPVRVLTCLPTRCFTSIKTQAHGFYICSHLNSSLSTVSSKKNKSQTVNFLPKNDTFSSRLRDKVKQNGIVNSIGMALLSIVAIVGAGAVLYVLGLELLSTQSPHGIYNEAHKLCQKNEKVIYALGEPMTARLDGYGRSTFVNYHEFMEGETKVMKVQFYLFGPHANGMVFVVARQDSKGVYEIAKIVLELEHQPHFPIIVFDK